MRLRDAKRSLRGLTHGQLRKLDEWVRELIEQTDKAGRVQGTNKRDPSGKKRAGQKTYRLERVRCGSKKCKCASGELHGPYWYAYWSEGGRTKSQYIGKKLPNKRKR